MQSKTVLVTGGAGFIGSHVVDAFLKKNNKVVVIDDFNKTYSPSIKQTNLAHQGNNPNLKVVVADIRKAAIVSELFKQHQFELVIHLAARAGVRDSLLKPKLFWDVNVMGSLNLLMAMKENNVKKLIFASSSSVYGNRTHGPFAETDTSDLQVSPYSASKKALEILSATYAHLYHINTFGLRLFNVYGPRNRPNMACSNFLEAALQDRPIIQYGDGSTGRDYTYIDDIVRGILLAADKVTGYELINLGNHTPVKLSTLIETIEKITKHTFSIIKKPDQQGDVKLTFADISKAHKLLGWQPETSLEEGLTQLWSWYIHQHQGE